jgi:hypothetical protein
MKAEEVASFYDRVFDQDYVAKYKAARISEQPAIDAELRDLKASYRRTVAFGTLPTGIDQTPLKGEYNYKHEESMMTVVRNDQKRYLFFVANALWKTYDELPLKQGGEFGGTYREAVAELQKRFGVAGRAQAADFEHGRASTEVDWVDPTTHVRALDRSGENVLGLVYEDRYVSDRILAWRAAQKGDDNSIDPMIAAATKGGAVNDPNAHAADAYTGKAHSDPAAPPPPPAAPGAKKR